MRSRASQKRRESHNWCCVSQDSDALDSQGTKEFRGDPMQKDLNAIQRVRFTKSALRQASIRCKAVDKCLFPHHEVLTTKQKSQRKATIPTKEEKRRQECSGYGENCTTIGLRLARLGCVGSQRDKQSR